MGASSPAFLSSLLPSVLLFLVPCFYTEDVFVRELSVGDITLGDSASGNSVTVVRAQNPKLFGSVPLVHPCPTLPDVTASDYHSDTNMDVPIAANVLGTLGAVCILSICDFVS